MDEKKGEWGRVARSTHFNCGSAVKKGTSFIFHSAKEEGDKGWWTPCGSTAHTSIPPPPLPISVEASVRAPCLPLSADAFESAGCDQTRKAWRVWPEIPNSLVADWLAAWPASLKAESLRAKRRATRMCDCLFIKAIADVAFLVSCAVRRLCGKAARQAFMPWAASAVSCFSHPSLTTDTLPTLAFFAVPLYASSEGRDE